MTKEMEVQPLMLELQVLDDQCEGHQTFPMQQLLLQRKKIECCWRGSNFKLAKEVQQQCM